MKRAPEPALAAGNGGERLPDQFVEDFGRALL
jgi:hypothetical protein